jgi:hypothetical protein
LGGVSATPSKKSSSNPLSHAFQKLLRSNGDAGVSAKLKPKYKVIGMRKAGGLQKDLNNALQGMHVPYLSEEERQAYLVTFEDGKLHQGGAPLDTSHAVDHLGSYLFVMDSQGRFFAGSSSEVIHHSAFLAGKPVAAAGAMRVVDGRLVMLSNSSGHYMPPLDYIRQALTELKKQRIDLGSVEQNLEGQSKKELKKVMKKRNFPPNERLYPFEVKKKYY